MNSKLRFDLRRFEGEGEPEMVEIKNPTDGTIIKVTEETKALIESISAIARKDASKKSDEKLKLAKDALEEYKGENETVKKTLEDMELEGKDEVGKLKLTYAREKKALEDIAKKAQEESTTWKTKYESNKIKTDIFGSFGEHVLNNIDHTATLFKQECKADLQGKIDSEGNPTGEYQTVMSMVVPDGKGGFDTVSGNPKELFDRWIKQDSHRHLLKNSLIPGGGSAPGGDSANLSELQQAEKEYDEAMKAGKVLEAIPYKTKIGELKSQQKG